MSCLAFIQKSWGHLFLSKILRYLFKVNDYSRVSITTFLLGSGSVVSVVEPSSPLSSSLLASSSTGFSVWLSSPSRLSTSVLASTSAVALLSCGPSSWFSFSNTLIVFVYVFVFKINITIWNTQLWGKVFLKKV